jgi:hypothetical protein
MPKKLTIFGALMALVFGALALFQGTATATPPPVQGFDSTGVYTVNSGTCWATGVGTPGHPGIDTTHGADTSSGAQIVCGPNTSETHVAKGVGTTAVPSFTYIQLPQGNRLTLPITFTPSAAGQFGTDPTQSACGIPTPGDCGAVNNPVTDTWTLNGSSVTGVVTAQTDLLCQGRTPVYDILAKTKPAGGPAWPNDPSDGDGWIGYDFARTASAAAGTGNPGGSNAYVNQIKPFPPSFPFVSLDTAILTHLFFGGGGTGFPISPNPLQLYTATSAYVAGLNVSVALLGGSPGNPPKNDYLCLDSPQNSETSTNYVVPPNVDGLFPRWTIFTSAADFETGAVDRIVDLQCVGVGSVTSGQGAADVGATDVDDDCLPTPADTNDGNPDQDNDGLPDGVEAFAGSSITVADSDADGASDYDEMFEFTNPNVADTDGDGSLDKHDNGADETPGSLIVDDTVADDNCPAVSNPDQLNTDSMPNYHGGSHSTFVNKNPLTGNTWASATISYTSPTVTVTTSAAHGLVANQLVEISGVTGMGGTAAQNNSFRNAVNGVATVRAAGLTATQFTYNPLAVAPAAPSPVLSGAVTGTIVVRPATGEPTNPDQDVNGDACDTDDDNDALGDVAEGNVTYTQPWVGPGTTSCVGDGSGVAGLISLSTVNGDSDNDMVLDGIECQQGGRPDVANAAAPYNCLPASNGCAQPKGPTAGEDPDADGLFGSGLPGGNAFVETFYHTTAINRNDTTKVTDIDLDTAIGPADKDADADWNVAALPGAPCTPAALCAALADGPEVKFYATEPANQDSDVDGCDDAREVADVNGDRTVSSGDQGIEAAKILNPGGLDTGANGDATAGDGQVNPYGINFDLDKNKTISSGDKGIMDFLVGKNGACQASRQSGLIVTNSKKLPFPQPF